MNRTEATQILMLSSDATFDDIKYAYRKLSLKLHPDRNKNEKDGRRFKNVLEAYHFLKGENRLKNYNDRNKSTQKKSSYNDRQHNPEEDWSRFTKDFEMDENFWRQYETTFWKDYELRTKKKSEKNDLGKAFWDESQENVNPKPKKKYQDNQANVFKHDLDVDVDKSLCIGCCSCETIAPNVFVVDKNVMMNPKSQVHNQHGASEGKIMDAAETCPTKAIQVNEKKSGRKIYPR
ncbi:DnaJ domain-containing protein [Marine Group I thaumarchaeote]|jgi:DnaJ-class molecular chaperone|uniref:Ferredoxin n=1 Tax=Marine Group I thaumarchaeote TaxID=2511932 RepID=A0A7K4MYK7_9ARCH|nr:DnaJ domain-containing protein [Marine Group I thaumarchaeote]PBO83696.1 MAG: molecular chaperone DnaJ [Nitrosopumilales archaeon]